MFSSSLIVLIKIHTVGNKVFIVIYTWKYFFEWNLV